MSKKPSSWQDFEYLARHDDELRNLMRIRAIELYFTSDNATAIRAGEFLATLEGDVDSDLDDIGSEELRQARARARAWLLEFQERKTIGNSVSGANGEHTGEHDEA
jgi:hypothetical protein